MLSKEEIKEILIESKKEKYSDPQVLMFGFKRTSIFKLSRETGLILPYGNEHIGYLHIIDRHSPTSRMAYWKDGKIGAPSKLPLGIPPIRFLDIAGLVFRPENRKAPRNHSETTFDIYEGVIPYRDSKVSLRLVTYKGTAIIQTLYPIGKQPKKVLKSLRRGFVSEATDYVGSCLQTFAFSYLDDHDVERFKIILRCSEFTLRQRWYVQVNDGCGIGKLTTLLKEESVTQRINFHRRMVIIDFSDTTWIERELKKMINNAFNY